jgi:hypothetical protein
MELDSQYTPGVNPDLEPPADQSAFQFWLFTKKPRLGSCSVLLVKTLVFKVES